MDDSTVAIVAIVVGALTTAGSGIGGYIVGKKQEINRLRLARAFPLAEEITVAVYDLHGTENHLTEWYGLNFGHLKTVAEAVRYMEESRTYSTGPTVAATLPEKRIALREKVDLARVYLNSEDLDRIEEYLSLGEFTSVSDGIGGLLFDDTLVQLFKNLLEPQRRHDRAELFLAIKRRLNRMHEL